MIICFLFRSTSLSYINTSHRSTSLSHIGNVQIVDAAKMYV